MDTERVNLAVYKNLPDGLGASDIDSIVLTGSHAHDTVIDDNDVDVTCVINPMSGPAIFGFNPFIQKKAKDGDIEISYISVRKLIQNLLKSSINALEIIFSPSDLFLKDGEAMASIQHVRQSVFLARSIGSSFMHYAEGQLISMDRARPNGLNSKRSMALEQFGYDPKAAAHALRAIRMCIEAFTLGYIQVRRTMFDAEFLKQIKRGAITLDEITSTVLADQEQAKFYYGRSEGVLPEVPDAERAEELLIDICQRSTMQRYSSWSFSRGFESGLSGTSVAESLERIGQAGYGYSKSHGLGVSVPQESTDTGVGDLEIGECSRGSKFDQYEGELFL